MSSDRAMDEVRAALAAAEDESATPSERAEMLMEMAMGLQQRPKSPDQLHSAVELYDKALAICPEDERLLRARITARKGTALQAIPEQGTASLERARAAFEEAIPTLIDFGRPEELAEAEMNLGVVVQNLAGAGRARIDRRDLGLSARAAHFRPRALSRGIRDPAEQSRDRVPVDAVHRRARQDARGDGRAGVRGRA